jgi:hypothetical protein
LYFLVLLPTLLKSFKRYRGWRKKMLNAVDDGGKKFEALPATALKGAQA